MKKKNARKIMTLNQKAMSIVLIVILLSNMIEESMIKIDLINVLNLVKTTRESITEEVVENGLNELFLWQDKKIDEDNSSEELYIDVLKIFENENYYAEENGWQKSTNSANSEFWTIYCDGHVNIAWGIVIDETWNYQAFQNVLGWSSKETKRRLDKYSYNGEIFTECTKDQVEQVFREMVRLIRVKVEKEVKGLGLTSDQIGALVTIMYLYGNLGNFKEVYKKYGNTIQLRENFRVGKYYPMSSAKNEYKYRGRSEATWSIFHNGDYNAIEGYTLTNGRLVKDGFAMEENSKSNRREDFISVALSQVGNEGGEPYWSWYGYGYRVAWCACYVSWCANEAGLLDESIPKFASCVDGEEWFKKASLWKEVEGYTPKRGDIVFFDFRNSDGIADHVGIVIEVRGQNVYTVEGNTGDRCETKLRAVKNILGYGTPRY